VRTRSASGRGARRRPRARAGQARTTPGRPAPRPARKAKRRRAVALIAAVGVGVGAGLVLANLDVFEETIREVTLPLRHDDIIRQQAGDKNLDPALIAAVIYAESRFRDQTSHAGARGLMQITPETANAIEKQSGGTTFVTEDLANPDINIRYGTYHLRDLMGKYGGNEVAALAAYNAGQAHVDGWGGAELDTDEIGFEETRDYVEEVLDKREEYREHYAEDLGLRR
jgi:soluble lytic murein transglycosylase